MGADFMNQMPPGGLPGGFQMPPGGLPGGFQMPPGGLPGGFQMPPGGLPGGFQMPPGGFQMPTGGLPGGFQMPPGGFDPSNVFGAIKDKMGEGATPCNKPNEPVKNPVVIPEDLKQQKSNEIANILLEKVQKDLIENTTSSPLVAAVAEKLGNNDMLIYKIAVKTLELAEQKKKEKAEAAAAASMKGGKSEKKRTMRRQIRKKRTKRRR